MADVFKIFSVTPTVPGGPFIEQLVGAVNASGGSADAGKVVLLDGSGLISPSMGGGGGSSNSSLAVNQTAHGFIVGQAIYYTGSIWALAEANNIGTLGIGIVSTVADADDFTVMFSGYIASLTGLTAGQYYFVSDSTAGSLTATEPISPTSFSNPLLFALSATTGVVLPFRPSSDSGGGGGGTGTVTSVGLSEGAIFSVSGTPVTSSGTLALSLLTQAANTVFAGPTTGSPAAPTFRTLVAADIPNLSFTVITTAINYTANALDDVWASGTINVTTPSTIAGRRFKVSNRGSGTITVLPASGTISGQASYQLKRQYTAIELVSDGTNWAIE